MHQKVWQYSIYLLTTSNIYIESRIYFDLRFIGRAIYLYTCTIWKICRHIYLRHYVHICIQIW